MNLLYFYSFDGLVGWHHNTCHGFVAENTSRVWK